MRTRSFREPSGAHCRSLGFARDDKGEGSASIDRGARDGRVRSAASVGGIFHPYHEPQWKRSPLLCHPERTRISCHAAPDTVACAPFSKERRMKFANATEFYRKSGAAEGSAVRPGWLPKASGSHTRSLAPASFSGPITRAVLSTASEMAFVQVLPWQGLKPIFLAQ